LVGVAALALSAAACSGSGGDSEGSEEEGETKTVEAIDAALLLEMVNENIRLEKDLDAAEDRIIAECLEAQGFTIHDQRYLGQNEPYELNSLVDFYPADSFLPEVDVAAEWGFGWWAQTAEMFDSEETQEYYEETLDFGDDDAAEFDNSAFESLPDDERRAWSVAYQGEEATAALEGTGGETEEGGTSDDGSLEFGGGETASAPKPGGCQLEMIEALYGEPQQVALDSIEGEEEYLVWEWRPAAPEVDLATVESEYAARMTQAQSAFLSCIDERGYPGWEFNDTGSLSMLDYSSLLYTGEVYEEELPPGVEAPEDTSPPVPDLPEDVPDDFDGKRAYEVEMAVAFAECGDETGYRETATSTYDQVLAEQYTAIETETYAWQEDIREMTVNAQELIAA
jgi:hypothetical protein